MSINRPERVRALDTNQDGQLTTESEKAGLAAINAEIDEKNRQANMSVEDQIQPITEREADAYLGDEALLNNPREVAKQIVDRINSVLGEGHEKTVNYSNLGIVMEQKFGDEVRWYDTANGPVVEVRSAVFWFDGTNIVGLEADLKRIIELNDPELYKYVETGLVTIKPAFWLAYDRILG
jgi:hypothetical protein